jgi:hypothetical protein
MNASYWNETRVRRSLRRGLLFVCFLIGAHVGCYGVAEQLACEEAAAHLTECCPGFNPEDIDCGHSSKDPFDNDPFNDISQDEATCILDKQCVDLVAENICDEKASAPFFAACP